MNLTGHTANRIILFQIQWLKKYESELAYQDHSKLDQVHSCGNRSSHVKILCLSVFFLNIYKF